MDKRFGVMAFGTALILLAVSCHSLPGRKAPDEPLAILAAFEQEATRLEAMLADAEAREIEGLRFVAGTLAGRPVVVGKSGVGKANAAMATTLLIEHFRPDRVLLTGIAGGVDPNLTPGDIVVAERTAHHDMGILWPEGIEPGGVRDPVTGSDNPTFFPADEALLAAARRAAARVTLDAVELKAGRRAPRVVFGTIVTGDAFIASEAKCAELLDTMDARAVEMEGAAVAQICYQWGIGCLVVRSIADKADESAVLDKQKFYELAGVNSVRLVVEIVRCLGQ